MHSLQIKGLTVHFEKQPALWDINFAIPQGSLTAIVGPNGAGKSTLIKAAMGLIPLVSGHVLFFDKSLSKMKQKVAYVPQRESVDWDFPITVLEVVMMGCYGRLGLFRRPKAHHKKEALALLERLHMKELSSKSIQELSGGQQQRVFIARALMQKADIYLMDEPFAGIDKTTEELIVFILEELKKEGKSVVIVHHDLATLERYFDHILLLNKRLVAFGKTADVLKGDNIRMAFGSQPKVFERIVN